MNTDLIFITEVDPALNYQVAVSIQNKGWVTEQCCNDKLALNEILLAKSTMYQYWGN
ncbi:hypothetical protein [Alteromonas sp. ASW11-130]|uniref:hypothetical protein n=1 Tax=Alteromonas sp. ASW11-130 TaxID=3015775 RepID=UPI002242ABD8|nr:hypothetical protein [Alteromonas sp. ASW11-130]MCW8093439.1 hypothetical protein [Alteromonas sp. ASW11-130]